jgi:heme b synthase
MRRDMKNAQLRMVAWEVTRQCNLKCIHCRASAQGGPYAGELSTDEALALLEEVASFAKPVVILTGGEPLLRGDILELASRGTALGLRMVMAVNGTLLTPRWVQELRAAGIQRISVSLDGSAEASHDAFRAVPGAFRGALDGIALAREGGLPFQINTTVTRRNLPELPRILDLAVGLGAAAHHIFLLVPTGRGKEMAEDAISPEDYERTLHWFYDQRERVPLQLKATCAPHYHRILRQRAKEEGRRVSPQTHGMDAVTRGCLGGTAFCFISHVGEVQPCGYLEVGCGNVRERPLSRIWRESAVFAHLRDPDQYKGKCGVCEYRTVCGGCRARAYEISGDYLAEEPFCTYAPSRGAP